MAASAACGFVRSSSASAASAIAARSTEQPKPRWRAKRDDHKARSALERAPKDKSTVEGFLNRWLDAKAAECGVATLHAYKWAITQHVIPYIGERRICDLDPLDIDELLSALRKPWGERKTACSTRTIRAVSPCALPLTTPYSGGLFRSVRCTDTKHRSIALLDVQRFIDLGPLHCRSVHLRVTEWH